jgi:hypothetical protein
MHVPDWLMGSAAALVASAAVRALPDPETPGSRLYLWFYRFAHALLANFDKVAETK